jgi:hypothetical protein
MAKPRFDLSFPFGALAPKRAAPAGGKRGRGRKRRRSAAQKATAVFYMQPRRR